MLLTVTPNLCIERTLKIPDFRAGEVHRVAPENLSVNAGGKGINAARVARELGAGVLALSWVGTNQRAWFEAELGRENIAFDFVEVESNTRVCVNILSGGGGKTEVVEAGHALSISDGEKMREKFESLLPLAELVAICGSYPSSSERSTPPAFPADLISLCGLAREHGKKVLVDGKGAEFSALLHLQSNAQVLPFAIKPNCDEASAFLEYSVHDESSERGAIRDFLELGIEVVLLSCGARGAYLGTRASTHFLSAPRVREVSAVGSGDAFVGAFCARFLKDASLIEAARWGVAAGAANASQARSAFCTKKEIEALLAHVAIEEINL